MDQQFNSSTSIAQRLSRRGSKNFNDYGFNFTTYLQENHEQPIYGIEFCNNLKEGEPIIFATCGSNRVTIYECQTSEIIILQCYTDPKADEIFYTCTWSFNPDTSRPILAAGGTNRTIRIFDPSTMTSPMHFIGHGGAINDLKFHPKNPNILLSASSDFSVRLWNVQTHVCIAIFGGEEGHRKEVMSVDFDVMGNRIVSCGMDHSVKIWRIDKSSIHEVIQSSFTFNRHATVIQHFPDFCTKDIHNNYVDCVKWMGHLVLSKSCENSIVCWKPHLSGDATTTTDSSISRIKKFEYDGGKLFYMRFSMDVCNAYMAVGNSYGTTTIWQLNGAEPTNSSSLIHFLCTATVRNTAFSRDGTILICVCDNATVWRWDRVDRV